MQSFKENESGVQNFKELEDVYMESFKENERGVQSFKELKGVSQRMKEAYRVSKSWKRCTKSTSSKENERGVQSFKELGMCTKLYMQSFKENERGVQGPLTPIFPERMEERSESYISSKENGRGAKSLLVLKRLEEAY